MRFNLRGKNNIVTAAILSMVLFAAGISSSIATVQAAGKGGHRGGTTVPTIVTQPASETVPAGKTATFSVVATSTVAMTYQWEANGVAIKGAKSATYTSPATTTANNGTRVTVVVTNIEGSVTSATAILTVNAPATTPPPPSTASYTLGAKPSAVAFSWQTGSAAPAAQSVKIIDNSANCEAISVAASQSWLAVTPSSGCTAVAVSVSINTAGLAAGSYSGSIMVSGATEMNSPFAVPVTLTVTGGMVAPSITSQPVSQTVKPGATATFNVAATGTAPMTYQWKNNGSMISGATSSTYTTAAETSSNSGSQITVVVANSAGSATSTAAMLMVSAPSAVAPAITSQPASQAVNSGATATFNVAATGTAPMTYQWNNNGSPISGATSSTYTTAALTSSNSGAQITVVVTNSAGSATSNPATLTVNAGTQTLSTSSSALSFGSVAMSSSGNQSVTLTNTGTAAITISNTSISGSGFTASGVPAGTILAAGQKATLNVTFSPVATGSVNGSVTIASNATNSPATISLSGSGAAAIQYSVALAWTASSSSVVGYNVYSSTNSGGSYTLLNSAPISSTSYTDSTVQAGQTYYYVVTSVNSSNVDSNYSAPVITTIP